MKRQWHRFKKLFIGGAVVVAIGGVADLSETKCNEVELKHECKIEKLQTIEKNIVIPDDVSVAQIAMSRLNWPAEKKATEVIFDLYDGQKWIPKYSGFTADGGDVFDIDGELVATSSVSFVLPRGQNREARLRIKGEEEIITRINMDFQ